MMERCTAVGHGTRGNHKASHSSDGASVPKGLIILQENISNARPNAPRHQIQQWKSGTTTIDGFIHQGPNIASQLIHPLAVESV